MSTDEQRAWLPYAIDPQLAAANRVVPRGREAYGRAPHSRSWRVGRTRILQHDLEGIPSIFRGADRRECDAVPPFAAWQSHPIGPTIDLGVRIPMVFGAVAAVRQLQQPVKQGHCRRLVGRDSHADFAEDVDWHLKRMPDGRAVAELSNGNGLCAFDAKNDRSVEDKPDGVSNEERAATHEEREAETASRCRSVEGVREGAWARLSA